MTAPGSEFLRFQVRGTDGVLLIDRLIQGIEERLTNFMPVWGDVVAAFRQINLQAFTTEGASTDGGAWPQLAKRTQRQRARLGFGPAHPILRRTDALMRALTQEENNLVRVTPTSLRYQLSPEVGYFIYHQSTAPRTHLPRRAPVSLTADQRTALFHPIRLWVTGHDSSAPARPRLR